MKKTHGVVQYSNNDVFLCKVQPGNGTDEIPNCMS